MVSTSCGWAQPAASIPGTRFSLLEPLWAIVFHGVLHPCVLSPCTLEARFAKQSVPLRWSGASPHLTRSKTKPGLLNLCRGAITEITRNGEDALAHILPCRAFAATYQYVIVLLQLWTCLLYLLNCESLLSCQDPIVQGSRLRNAGMQNPLCTLPSCYRGTHRRVCRSLRAKGKRVCRAHAIELTCLPGADHVRKSRMSLPWCPSKTRQPPANCRAHPLQVAGCYG